MKNIIKLLTIVVVFIFYGYLIYGVRPVAAKISEQKRTLIYTYNNSSNRNLGNNKYQFRKRIAASYQILTNNDTLINKSSHGEIKWLIEGKENYTVTKIGSGSAFEEKYKVRTKKFKIKYYIPDDWDMVIDGDSIKFVKENKVILRNWGMTIFDKDKNIKNKSKVKLWKNQLEITIDAIDSTDGFDVDPIWTWSPTEADGIDCYMQSNLPTDNYNTQFLNASSGAAVFTMRPLIKFSALTDSIPANAVITSAFLYMTNRGTNTEVSVDSMTSYILKRAFDETQATYNIPETDSTWGTSGATNVSDIYYAPADTNFNIGGTTKGLGALDTLDITNTTRLLVGVDSVYANNGIMIRGLNDVTRTANAYWLSSDSSGAEPEIVIDYTVPLLQVAFISFGDTIGTNSSVVKIDSVNNNASGDETNTIAVQIDDGTYFNAGGNYPDSRELTRVFHALSDFDAESLFVRKGFVGIKVYTKNLFNAVVDTYQVFKFGEIIADFADTARTSGVAGPGVTAGTLADSMALTEKKTEVEASINSVLSDSGVIRLPDGTNKFIKMK